jgi:acyl-CoA thioesterase
MADTARLLAQRVVEAMLRADRASQSLGIYVVSVDAGYASVGMIVREDMLNGHRTCHGGVLFALADSAFAFACNSRNQRTVAASGQIDFLRPALLGDILRAIVEERSAGKRLGLYDVTISNQRGESIAMFRGKSYRIDGNVVESTDAAEEAHGRKRICL